MKKEDRMFWIGMFILGTILTGGMLPILWAMLTIGGKGWRNF